MGRIEKMKRELIEESNKRILGESTIEYEDEQWLVIDKEDEDEGDEQSLPEQKAYKIEDKYDDDDDSVEVVKDDDYGDGKQGPYSSVFDLLDKKLGPLFSKLKKRKKEIKDLDYKAQTRGEKELQGDIKQDFRVFKDIQKREWKQLKYELRNERWDNFQEEVNTIINNIEEGADNVADSIAHFFKRMNKGIKDNIITPIQKKRFERLENKTGDILKRIETKENNIINKLKKKEEQIKRVKGGSSLDKSTGSQEDFSFQEARELDRRLVESILNETTLSHEFNDEGVGEESLEEHSDDMIVTMGGDDNDYGWYDKSNRQFRNDQINLDDYGDDETFDSWESYTDSDYYKDDTFNQRSKRDLEGQERRFRSNLDRYGPVRIKKRRVSEHSSYEDVSGEYDRINKEYDSYDMDAMQGLGDYQKYGVDDRRRFSYLDKERQRLSNLYYKMKEEDPMEENLTEGGSFAKYNITLED